MTDVASAMLAAQLLLVTLPKPGRLLFDGRVCLTEDHRCQTCGAPPGSVQYGKPMGWEHAADCAAHAQELEYAADLPRLVDAVQRIHARLASLLPAAEKLKEDLYMERQRSTGFNSQVISMGRELDRLRKALRIGIADDVSKALLSRIGEAVYAATAPILEAVEHGAQRINNGHHTAQKLAEDVKERLSFLTGRLPGTVRRWERRTLRARDYLAMEIERQGWDTSTGYLALQDMLDASDEYTFALRAIAESVGLPEDTDPLDDLDGLAERVKRCAERVAEAETVLTRVTPPHCEHSADAGHALGHGEHPDRGGPSLMDQEIERLGDQVRSLQVERDQLEEANGQLERDLLAVRRVPTKAQDGWYAVALVDARGSECASFHVEVPNGDRWDEVILAEATHHLSKRAVRGVLPLWAVAVPCKTDLCTVGVRLENVRMVLVKRQDDTNLSDRLAAVTKERDELLNRVAAGTDIQKIEEIRDERDRMDAAIEPVRRFGEKPDEAIRRVVGQFHDFILAGSPNKRDEPNG